MCPNTCVAPVNIAVIKYWGKRDENLILPINSSLSVTLDVDQLCTRTTIYPHAESSQDVLYLNGKKAAILPRAQNVIDKIRKIKSSDTKICIVSENNFPTAAGVASSAAGYACLASAVAKFYGVEASSTFARIGSGSACRSMFGGFVEWEMGSREDGEDSIAVPLPFNWPGIRILIFVASDSQKIVSSTGGMQSTVETSNLLKYRIANSVPSRLAQIKKAIELKDFDSFGRIMMADSNETHATMMDTFPPIRYISDSSFNLLSEIHRLNKKMCRTVAAYTFDAGSNAFVFTMEEDADFVYASLSNAAGKPEGLKVVGIPLKIPDSFENVLGTCSSGVFVKYVISTQPGGSPRESDDHLPVPV